MSLVSALVALLLALLPAPARPWCSPADTGDCALNIRAGRSATDADYRAVRFLDQAHGAAGAIRVRPQSRTMEFLMVGEQSGREKSGKDSSSRTAAASAAASAAAAAAAAPQLTISDTGVTAEAGLRVRGVLDVVRDGRDDGGAITAPVANVTAVHADRIVAARSVHARNVSVAGELRGRSIVADEQLRCATRVLSSDVDARPGRGAYLDPLGSVEIFSDGKDAHVDLKSTLEEDFAVRALQATPTNGLLVHGQRVLITAAGKVGVGVDKPTHALHVNGRVRAASATITTGSDRRIKANVRAADASLAADRIRRLRVRRYDLHPAYAASQGIEEHRRVNRTGFIAQELQKVVPEAVEERDGVDVFGGGRGSGSGGDQVLRVDKLLTVDLEPVLFDLVQTVQRLQRELDEMKKEQQQQQQQSLRCTLECADGTKPREIESN
jgi:hypothetical protein